LQALLQVLISELSDITQRQDVHKLQCSESEQLVDKITPVMQALLPSLKLYNIWFLRCWKTLGVDLDGQQFDQYETFQLWEEYAACASALDSAFPSRAALPSQSEFLLTEDFDTLGFAPLTQKSSNCGIWASDDGSVKKRYADRPQSSRTDPRVESLMRIRKLLDDMDQLVEDKVSVDSFSPEVKV
jgi:hypothetical protein